MDEPNKAVFYKNTIGVGGSLGVIIPTEVVDFLSLKTGDKVQIHIEVVKRNSP